MFSTCALEMASNMYFVHCSIKGMKLPCPSGPYGPQKEKWFGKVGIATER